MNLLITKIISYSIININYLIYIFIMYIIEI